MSSLAAAYLWIKVLHILSVVAWMAGLFYLPRLFVYHAGVGPGSEASETFKLMERRLLRAIMHPAMAASYVSGLLLAFTPGAADWGAGWFDLKVAAAVGLGIFHFRLAGWQRDFAADRNRHSGRFFRFINEVPTLLLIAIVILVVMRPF
ncbi:MAG TPA: protoporphyrinogen oxidase HemJ [Stellaceae bacterium]|nr:protoporphyrinogen oxidase HemJ [Stellaceae bacterium]